jgi:hypothetical protein
MRKETIDRENRIARPALDCEWVCTDEADVTQLIAGWMTVEPIGAQQGAPPVGAVIASLARVTHAEV